MFRPPSMSTETPPSFSGTPLRQINVVLPTHFNSPTNNVNLGLQQPLPPGYRFHPTDIELIVHYLDKKVKKLPLPATEIPEVDLYKFDADTITDMYPPIVEGVWYFFTQRDKVYKNGKKVRRTAGRGHWKSSGKGQEIKNKGALVGSKGTFVFHTGKDVKSGQKTDWIMHEYSLHKANDTNLDDWVLCRIYNRAVKCAKKDQENDHDTAVEEDEGLHDEIPTLLTPIDVTEEIEYQETHNVIEGNFGNQMGYLQYSDAVEVNVNLISGNEMGYLQNFDAVEGNTNLISVNQMGYLQYSDAVEVNANLTSRNDMGYLQNFDAVEGNSNLISGNDMGDIQNFDAFEEIEYPATAGEVISFAAWHQETHNVIEGNVNLTSGNNMGYLQYLENLTWDAIIDHIDFYGDES